MRSRFTSPVQDVSFGQALSISLDNYYDLLKVKVGGFGANEYLQLKLVADPVTLSDDKASAGGYRWWSNYNLLVRSDVAIRPDPVDAHIYTSAQRLTAAYGEFLNTLTAFVAINNLTHQQTVDLAALKLDIQTLRDENLKLLQDDQRRWREYADLMGYGYGDRGHYLAWAPTNSNDSDIRANDRAIREKLLQKKRILDTQYNRPIDRTIVDASAAYDSSGMMLGYPIHPDYYYDDGDRFSVNYLSTMVGDGTGNALFDARRVFTWSLTLKDMLTIRQGGFDAKFDRTTGRSTSITRDWNASGSGGWGFIRASASASSHTAIQEDFNHGKSIALHAEAAFRANIVYPGWFQPTLFECDYIKDNPGDFAAFFGPAGRLLYYPTALILVRGFSASFESHQNWTYDYQHSFSASAGGGFSAFGVSFGAKGGYSENTHQHEVDQSNTTLTFADDKATIRFVGYAVAKNTIFDRALDRRLRKDFGKAAYASLAG